LTKLRDEKTSRSTADLLQGTDLFSQTGKSLSFSKTQSYPELPAQVLPKSRLSSARRDVLRLQEKHCRLRRLFSGDDPTAILPCWKGSRGSSAHSWKRQRAGGGQAVHHPGFHVSTSSESVLDEMVLVGADQKGAVSLLLAATTRAKLSSGPLFLTLTCTRGAVTVRLRKGPTT